MDKLDIRIIPEFSGDSDSGCVVRWFECLELVAKLRKIESEIVTIIPLRLAGDAYDVYAQIPDEDKKSVEKVKESLTKAFSIDSFSAYDKFVNRKLKPNESVDAFLADLKRISSIFGGTSDKILICAFVAGLPENVRLSLRSSSKIEGLDIKDILGRARIILSDSADDFGAGALGNLSLTPDGARGRRLAQLPSLHTASGRGDN